jgi:hypothetical protein
MNWKRDGIHSSNVSDACQLLLDFGSAFAVWLARMAEENKVEAILFLSRDGYWFKEIFDFMAEEDCIKSSVSTFYLLTSRSAQKISGIVEDCAINDHKSYLGKDLLPDKVYGVVDIGWNGSSLKYFSSNFPQSHFIGLNVGCYAEVEERMFSYLGKLYFLRFLGFAEYLETIFSAPHPSVSNSWNTSTGIEVEYFISSESHALVNFQQNILNEFMELKKSHKLLPLIEQSLLKKSYQSFYIRKNFFFPSQTVIKDFSFISHSSKASEKNFQPLVTDIRVATEDRVLMPLWNLYFLVFLSKLSLRKKMVEILRLGYNQLTPLARHFRRI